MLEDHLMLVEDYMNSGQIERALSLLEELSKIYPDNYHVASLLGECYLTLGKPDKAIKPLQWATKQFEVEQAKATDQTVPELTTKIEKISDDEKRIVIQIKRSFQRKEKDSLWVDHYLLGCALGRCMKFRPAIRHLNIANTMNPNNAEIIRNIGWIRCMQDNINDGRELLKKAIKLDPSNALAYNDLGASYMFEENLEEAQTWLKKAVELDPEDEFIHNTAEKLEELMAYKTLFGVIPKEA
jgi:Flp pilus assembly protein TadD